MFLAKHLYSRTDLFYPLRFDHMDTVSNFAVPLVCRSERIRDEFVRRCDGIVEIRPIVGGDMTNQPFFQNMFAVMVIGKFERSPYS